MHFYNMKHIRFKDSFKEKLYQMYLPGQIIMRQISNYVRLILDQKNEEDTRLDKNASKNE